MNGDLAGGSQFASEIVMQRSIYFVPSEDQEPQMALMFGYPFLEETDDNIVSLWQCVNVIRMPNDTESVASSASSLPSMLRRVYEEIKKGEGSDSSDQRSESEKMSNLANHRWARHQERSDQRRRVVAQMNAGKMKGENLVCSGRDVGVDARSPVRFNQSQVKSHLTPEFLDQCWENIGRGRPSYSEKTYEIAMLLYLTSPKTYRILGQILTLPSFVSLYRKFGERITEAKTNLTEMKNIDNAVLMIRKEVDTLQRSGTNVNCEFTLAVDAFAFRSFSGATLSPSRGESSMDGQRESVSDGQVKYTNGFLFLLIAHDYRIPVKIVHLSASKSGVYTKEIAAITERIIDSANSRGLRVLCRATDGDPGVATEHTTFYESHIRGKSSHFSKLVENVHQWLVDNPKTWIPISDPLHIFKNMRARILSHPIRLYPDSGKIDFDGMRKLLDLGEVLNDESQIGKMRDCYVLSLFTFHNVAALLEDKQYVNGSLLFPFACWMAAIFSPTINLGFRMFLVEVSFQLLSDWLSDYDELKKMKVSIKYRKEQESVVFCEPQYVHRMLNTLTVFGVALRFGADNIRLDALGTHLVENAIGIARSTSHDPRYERIVTCYAHNELRKKLGADLGVTLHVPGRVNSGGCKVDPDYKSDCELIAKPSEWRVDDILQLFRGLTNSDTSPALELDAKEFVSELREISPQLDLREYKVNEAANSTIMARLIKFTDKQRI